MCAPPRSAAWTESSETDAAGSRALREVTGVRGDVPAVVLLPWMERAPWGVPVVDDANRFLGFVSSRALAARSWPHRVLAVAPARELACERSLRVAIGDPLPTALRWMAHKGARAVALVDEWAELKGVLTDIDALRGLPRL